MYVIAPERNLSTLVRFRIYSTRKRGFICLYMPTKPYGHEVAGLQTGCANHSAHWLSYIRGGNVFKSETGKFVSRHSDRRTSGRFLKDLFQVSLEERHLEEENSYLGTCVPMYLGTLGYFTPSRISKTGRPRENFTNGDIGSFTMYVPAGILH